MTEFTPSRKRHVSVRYRKQWRRRTWERENDRTAVPSSSHDEITGYRDNPRGEGLHDSQCDPHTSRHSISDLSEHEETGVPYLASPPISSNLPDTPTSDDETDSESEYEQQDDLDDLFVVGHPSESLPQRNSDGGLDPVISSGTGSYTYPACIAAEILLQKHVLSALCLVVGGSRLTANQYRTLRTFLNHEGNFSRREGYPSYSSICATILPVMRKFVYAPTVLQQLQVDCRRSGAPAPSISATGDIIVPKKPVKVILPSSWARKDVATIPCFTSNSGITNESRTCPIIVHSRMESVPILLHRSSSLRSNILQAVSVVGDVFLSDSNVHDVTESVISDIEILLHDPPPMNKQLLISIGAFPEQQDGRPSMCLKARIISTTLNEISQNGLLPGDVVSFLHIPSCPSEHTVLLVHRMKRVKRVSRQPPQAVVIRRSQETEPSVVYRCKRITAIHGHKNHVDQVAALRDVETHGKLADGRLYSVYRFILYSDDFRQFTHKKGSAGGCYLLPVGLPLKRRRGVGAVRVISLTPPGVSTNKVILSIIPDIVAATKTGITVTDFSGVERTVFIEIVGYIGDYVAVQHVQDLAGPRGNAPCLLCTFKKGSTIGASTTDYACSVTTHSGHAAFRRDKQRMRALRKTCTTESELQGLGLRKMSLEQEAELPLHAISDALENVRDAVPKTEHGNPVVSAIFDPYLSSLVAPDHLFSGLAEDVINTNMRLLSKQKRYIAESLIRHALTSNGLPCENHLYNHEKIRLHSMSISTMYNVLLVAPWAIYMTSAYRSDGHRNDSANAEISTAMKLLFLYQSLVSETNFFPQCDVDGKDAVVRYNDSQGETHLMKLKEKCASYIRAVDSFCSTHVLAKKELDKPNIHRLLELYNHTIPLLGHVRQGQELLFEAAHQPLKRGLKQSNQKDAQLTAMDDMLANDWKSRLSSTLRACNISSTKDLSCLSESHSSKLKEVLCGDATGPVSRSEQDISVRIRDCFKNPVIQHLLSSRFNDNHNIRDMRQWIAMEQMDNDTATFPPIPDTSDAIDYIYSLYSHDRSGRSAISRVTYAKSVYRRNNQDSYTPYSGKIPKPSFYILRRLDLIQAAVRRRSRNVYSEDRSVELLHTQGEFPDCATSTSSERKFWIVLDILHMSLPTQALSQAEDRTEMFVIVWPLSMQKNGSSPLTKHYTAYTVTDKVTKYIIPLKPNVLKVLSLHICNWKDGTTCRVTPHTHICGHNGSIENGDPFVIFGTAEGYPPRDG